MGYSTEIEPSERKTQSLNAYAHTPTYTIHVGNATILSSTLSVERTAWQTKYLRSPVIVVRSCNYSSGTNPLVYANGDKMIGEGHEPINTLGNCQCWRRVRITLRSSSITASAWSALNNFFVMIDEGKKTGPGHSLSWNCEVSIGCLGHAQGVIQQSPTHDFFWWRNF